MTDPHFHIDSPRLYISYLQPDNPDHCDFLVQLYNSPEFIASIGGKPTSVTSRDAARAQLAGRMRADHARNGYGTYLVSLKPSVDADQQRAMPGGAFAAVLARSKPVGIVSLMRGEAPNSYSVPDLGFAVLPGEMRKGYAKEAALSLMAYAERELGVTDGVLGLCDPANAASHAVFRSLGFADRGIRPLKVFGGVDGAVWTKPGMDEDLGVYGF